MTNLTTVDTELGCQILEQGAADAKSGAAAVLRGTESGAAAAAPVPDAQEHQHAGAGCKQATCADRHSNEVERASAAGYQFDAFFSYKRDRHSDRWHENVKDKLAFWLRQELNREDVRIFFDTEGVRTGMRWSERLSEALRRSKCLICIWSPLYFRSQWCVSEWMTFVERSRLCNSRLVMPAAYFDGQNFPADARSIAHLDFSEYTSTMPRFWNTKSAVRFEKECIKPFASDIAEIIRRAPPYDDAFPVHWAVESAIQQE
jgi:hypothetical protein